MTKHTVFLAISDCLKCPHSKNEKLYTGDSWDTDYTLHCLLKNKKLIAYLDWHDNSVTVPQWCPLKK